MILWRLFLAGFKSNVLRPCNMNIKEYVADVGARAQALAAVIAATQILQKMQPY